MMAALAFCSEGTLNTEIRKERDYYEAMKASLEELLKKIPLQIKRMDGDN